MPMKTSVVCACILCALAALPAARAETKEPPVPVRTVAPDYPDEMHRNGVSGVVTVKCTIDEHGNVVGTEVLKSTDQVFTQPAVEALLKWKFKPATVDGKPVTIKAVIPVKFIARS
jgi:protein TonB